MPIEDVGTTVAQALAAAGPHLTKSRLDTAVGSISPDRGTRLHEFVFGSIVWPVDLGRPDGGLLRSGFEITHEYTTVEIDQGPEGPVAFQDFVTANDVSVWDGPEDNGRYAVYFLAHWVGLPPNRFTVALTAVRWQRNGLWTGVRTIRPPSAYVAKPGGMTFLEFEVATIPYVDIDRAGVFAGP
jgi:hypothetical protein